MYCPARLPDYTRPSPTAIFRLSSASQVVTRRRGKKAREVGRGDSARGRSKRLILPLSVFGLRRTSRAERQGGGVGDDSICFTATECAAAMASAAGTPRYRDRAQPVGPSNTPTPWPTASEGGEPRLRWRAHVRFPASLSRPRTRRDKTRRQSLDTRYPQAPKRPVFAPSANRPATPAMRRSHRPHLVVRCSECGSHKRRQPSSAS